MFWNLYVMNLMENYIKFTIPLRKRILNFPEIELNFRNFSLIQENLLNFSKFNLKLNGRMQ